MYKKNRKVDNMRSKNKKTIVIGILCCLLVFMGVGFAVLNQTLNIGGTTTATNTWAVLIESITPIENNTGAKSTSSEVLADKVSANFKVEFQKPGDYMEYTVVVANKGSIDATLKTVTSEITPESDASLFTFDYSEAPQGKTLAAGETTSFKIKITYNLSATTTPTGDVVFNLDLDYVQGTGSEGEGETPGTGEQSDWLFEVDENGEVVAYNYNSTLTETPQNVVVPATVGGTPVTTITEQSFIPKGNFSAYMDEQNMKIYALISEDDTVIVDTANNRTAVQVVGYKALMALTYEQCQGDASCLANYTGITYLCTDKNSCYAYTDETRTITASVPESGLSTLVENMYINPDPNVALEESIVEPKANVETLDLSNATNLTTIEENALSDTGLTSVEFGDNSSVTTIGDYAFANNELTSVEIPASVESIGNNAFYQNSDATTKLESVTFETETVAQSQLNKNNKYSLSRMGSTVTKLTSQKSALRSIGNNAFRNNAIKSLTLPDGLETIGSYAFHNNEIEGQLVLPSTLTSLGDNAFRGNEISGELVIPNGLTTINGYVFYDNSISKLTIPSTVTEIGDSAFVNNAITELIIPKTVTSLGYGAFSANPIETLSIEKCTTSSCRGNSSSGSIIFGNNIKTLIIESGEIGSNAFTYTDSSVNKITSLTLGEGVTSIGDSAFRNNAITELVVPSTVTTVGNYAFDGNEFNNLTIKKCTTSSCFAFSSGGWEKFGTSIKNLTVESGEIADYAFSRISNLTNLTLGRDVTSMTATSFKGSPIVTASIGECTTYTCTTGNFGTKLTNLTIESGDIGDYAFVGSPIKSLTIGSLVYDIGDSAFIYSNAVVYATGSTSSPSYYAIIYDEDNYDAIKTILSAQFDGLTFTYYKGSEKTIPTNTLLTVGYNVDVENSTASMSSGSMINQLDLSAATRLSIIGQSAFAGIQVDSLTVDASTIGDSAFAGSSISTLILGKHVTEIGSDAFRDAPITNLTIGKCTTDICSDRSFGTTVKNLIIESGEVGERAFSHYAQGGTPSLESLTLGEGVTSVGHQAFSSQNLSSIELPSTLQYIGSRAFSGNFITKVVIPASVTDISSDSSIGCLNQDCGSFYGNMIEELIFEEGSKLTNIGYYAFSRNKISGELILPSKVQAIGDHAFESNQITHLELPESIVSIGLIPFAQNPTLSSIFINRTEEDFLTNVTGATGSWYDTTLNPTIRYKEA